MAKNAYLIVSDLHKSYKNLANRIDYRAENQFVEEFLIVTAEKYMNSGYHPVMILLGDVFHNSYNNVFNAITDNNFFVLWERKFGKIYSVLGNHELTYYSSNPFYTLISEMKSEKVRGIMNKVWQPVGLYPVLTVPDKLEDGQVTFYFNHYSTGISRPDSGKINIGLFHQDIVNKQVVCTMEDLLGEQVFAKVIDFDSVDIFDGYNYCFFGHMHKMYGIYRTDSGCTLVYLASLNRTNVSEVSDRFLERNVPVVKVEDGEFAGIDSNKFELMTRAECVNEVSVEKARETYELQKARKYVRDYTPSGDDPVLNLKNKFSDSYEILTLINELRGNEMDSKSISLLGRINRL